jgi:hypothetical protein
MHGNEVKPAGGLVTDEREPLTVPELMEALGVKERRAWQILASGELGEAEHRQITDGLGRVHLQRVVPARRVDAYLAERGSGGSAGTKPTGGAGSGPKPTGPTK